jgi:hypothetical protein
MNAPFECCDVAPRALTRRDLLKTVAAGFGWAAFAGLATRAALAESITRSPLAMREPQLPARAKRVIFLCMQGGPAHQDTFDYKPRLQRDHGKPGVGKGRGSKLVGSPFAFRQHGQSGLWMSELFPNLGRHADRLCMIHSMRTDIPNHPQAFIQLHTGSAQFVRPSMGSWVLYGLGSANQNLPGFVNISPPSQLGAANYGSAFLPAVYQGTRIGSGGSDAGMNHVANDRFSATQQRRQLDFVQAMNLDLLARSNESGGNIEAAIESGELAFRMQAEVPHLMDISNETQATRKLYGIGETATDSFGRQCLLARRFAEAGSRFIEVNLGGWDQHQNLETAMRKNCKALDQPTAALLQDLESRGLLKDTLVLWGGEFGRTPDSRRDDGRDHNNQGFTMWMAGGGIQGGKSFGATDAYGAKAVENPVHVHDLHATILHCLGLDHERLTYRYGGRDYRLTDVHGNVVKGILA